MHKNGKENVMKVKTLLLLLVLIAGIGGLGYYCFYWEWEKEETKPAVVEEEPEEDFAPTKEDIQKEQKQLNKSIKIFQMAKIKKMISEDERRQLNKILNESTLNEAVRLDAEYAADVLYAKWCAFYRVRVDYSIFDASKHRKCRYCGGNGSRECVRCSGDGICWHCKGSGKARSVRNDVTDYSSHSFETRDLSCSSCVLGKCSECKGKGKIVCISCNESGVIVALDDYKRQLAIALEGIKEHIQENTKILKQMQEDEEKSVKPEAEQK